MNIDQARFNMVEQQIRTWEVLDQDVLDLLYVIKREDFVPPAYRTLAFSDLEIPIGSDAFMWQPKLEARVLQELAVKSADKVLEIGTGSGYLAALLAHRAAIVHSVEIHPELVALAKGNLDRSGVSNVKLELGDGARGWATHGPYDVIVLTGSTPVLPPQFLQQLRIGGRLFAIVGEAPVMEARLITCTGEGAHHSIDLFETCTAPLKNALDGGHFSF